MIFQAAAILQYVGGSIPGIALRRKLAAPSFIPPSEKRGYLKVTCLAAVFCMLFSDSRQCS
jgi:hypothetical protein